MKLCDMLCLVKNEFKYEKKEWIVNVVLHILIFSCTFFVFSLAMSMNGMGDNYLKKMYKDGYTFFLNGYTEKNETELEDMGFYNLHFDGTRGSGTLDEIDSIWTKKIKATITGKDIWNEDIDEFILMLGLFEVIFVMLAILMIFLSINNLSNSFAMKLIRRNKFILMLSVLGYKKRQIKGLYYTFFCARNVISLLISCGVNISVIKISNTYIGETLRINSGIQILDIIEVIGIFVCIETLMWASFRKVWNRNNENN